MNRSTNPRFEVWKKYKNYLYDYIFENNFDWPCSTCQWGPVISSNQDYVKQRVYFACRTDGVFRENENTWEKIPSFLVVANIDIPKRGKTFNQELNHVFLQHNLKKCPNLKVKQIIVHPGDTNIMKKSVINPKWVATKTDNNHVYIWNLEKHKFIPSFKENNIHADIPDITLLGHSKMTSFALDWAKTSNRIASGGKDAKVLIWDLDNYDNSISSSFISSGKRELNSITGGESRLTLSYKEQLIGHDQTVEDISFHPKDRDILMSVGHDKKIIGWDLRIDNYMVFQLNKVHDDDINCVDWNVLDENYIACGSADSTVSFIDFRMQKVMVKVPMGSNKSPIQCIRFCPFNRSLVGVGSDNLQIYNYDNFLYNEEQAMAPTPIFTHLGYRGNIADFEWNAEDQWSFLAACQENDGETTSGGGTLHIFRPLDLIYLEEKEALKKLSETL